MNKTKRHTVSAFTIFEITVVLGLMSTLVGIIGVSINRFNEQLHQSADISHELNHFRAIRSELWREFYFADSIINSNGEITIYEGELAHQYKNEGGRLHHFEQENWKDMKLEIESIHTETKGDALVHHIDILWKGDVMHLDYHFKPGADKKINKFFDDLYEG